MDKYYLFTYDFGLFSWKIKQTSQFTRILPLTYFNSYWNGVVVGVSITPAIVPTLVANGTAQQHHFPVPRKKKKTGGGCQKPGAKSEIHKHFHGGKKSRYLPTTEILAPKLILLGLGCPWNSGQLSFYLLCFFLLV